MHYGPNPITGRTESHTGEQCGWRCPYHHADYIAGEVTGRRSILDPHSHGGSGRAGGSGVQLGPVTGANFAFGLVIFLAVLAACAWSNGAAGGSRWPVQSDWAFAAGAGFVAALIYRLVLGLFAIAAGLFIVALLAGICLLGYYYFKEPALVAAWAGAAAAEAKSAIHQAVTNIGSEGNKPARPTAKATASGGPASRPLPGASHAP